MPSGKPISKHLATWIQALSDLGKTQNQVADIVGVPQTTVSDILTGKGRWAAVKQEAWFDVYRKDQKRRLQAASLELSWKALEQLEKAMPRANVSQAAITYGILRDKERLDAGEATQNIAVVARVEADALNQTLKMLVESLKSDAC